jgi:transcription elongation factor GreA
MNDREPMTREGYEKLKGELDYMQGPKMIDITKRIAAAREMGDLSENAEYHAAREDQGILQAQINDLKFRLSKAFIIDRSTLPNDVVAFGAKVKVKDLDLDDVETFHLVGAGEDNANENRILTTSPIGQGLLGKKIGDVAEIKVPMGTLRFEVLEISFPD